MPKLVKYTLPKLLMALLFVTAFLSCKEEPAAEPLVQYHFLNFTDATGQNLFESGKINTADFHYKFGDNTSTWDETLAHKKDVLTPSILESMPAQHLEAMATMLQNDNMLLEHYQGNLEREQVMVINGAQYTFRYSLQDGFFQNGRKLQATTNVIDAYHVYAHDIVLEEF